MARRKIKGVSFGTVLALILTAIILIGSGYVLLRLSSGHTVDLSRLSVQVFSTETAAPAEEDTSVRWETDAPADAPGEGNG